MVERETNVDRMYRLYVEDPYIWISPFEAYAQVQYELMKLEKDRDRLEDRLDRLTPYQHADRGILQEKLLDLDVAERAVQSIDHKF